MKTIFIFLLVLGTFYARCQEITVEPKEIFGCWKFIEFADSLTLDPLTGIESTPSTIEFHSDFTFKGLNRNGDWKYVKNENKIILYKNEFTKEDKEMASYFKQDVRESTKMELLGIRIIGNNLYYLIAHEELQRFVQIYAKYEKMNCP